MNSDVFYCNLLYYFNVQVNNENKGINWFVFQGNFTHLFLSLQPYSDYYEWYKKKKRIINRIGPAVYK